MRIETISYLKKHAANLELDEPMIVTQSGKPVYRIESAETAELRDEGIALLKLMNLAERDIKENRTYSANDTLDKLAADLTNGKVDL